MCLFEDRYFIDGVYKQQVEGVAMGNCAAPPCAIIYMHYVEKEIQAKHPGIHLWRRYIDDIFFIVDGLNEQLLEVANTITSCIQFTLENPVDNKLPFLDTLVHLQDGTFKRLLSNGYPEWFLRQTIEKKNKQASTRLH
jgi:hypothetical protein